MDGHLHVWDLTTGQETRKIEIPGREHLSELALAPDGHTLALGGPNNTLQLWDLETGQKLRTLTTYKDGLNSITFSPDGKLVASSAYGKIARNHGALTPGATGPSARAVTTSATVWSAPRRATSTSISASPTRNVIRMGAP